jgi:type I restriction enzyme R subunit
MKSQTTEKALEESIERYFIGSVTDLSSPASMVNEGTPESGHAGYVRGVSGDFDRRLGLDRAKLWKFLEATQPEELAKLQYKPDWKRQVEERLSRKIKKDGILSVLKKGLSVDAAHLDLLYRLPYNTLAPEVLEKFDSNVFSCTRQLYYSSENTNSLDMVLFLNGMPIVTMELKNPWTGQNVNHANKQYREDRDPKETIFEFARCLVHFAVDPEEAWMTTRLAGKDTYFLPFNKGNNDGKGNPANAEGPKSAYLWTEILTRHSLCNIIEHFAKVTEEKDKKTHKIKKTLFFPRYHQLETVRGLLAETREQGVGNSYLIQHSAGSGKSNSITWLAFQLIELYDKTGEENLFDSVIVVTDRRVLDKQIDSNIRQFTEVRNLVAHASRSADLQAALENGKKLITTTIQKFPFIVDGIGDMSGKRFAVIIDEAHSSQSGSSADSLNAATSGNSDDEEADDTQDKILQAMKRRKMSGNASFYAFTATPKRVTLEKFGDLKDDGSFKPFRLYSMKQAIEEGFILDVLANYTTYKSYYEVRKSIADNPEYDTVKAQKMIRAHVEANPETIAAKAAIMVEHFQTQVVRPKKLKGKAKAMVVTRDIKCAIRYHQKISLELKRLHAPYKAIVAFSGEKEVDGITHTEDSINGFPAKDIPDKLQTDEYRLLIVANKFLTGYDEPLLHSMYVDKKLQGVIAVQALSRLNRCNVKMNKQETFVLDFFNSITEMQTSFNDFYTATSLKEATDINVLHDLQEELEGEGIFGKDQIERFNTLYFEGADQEFLHPILDETVTLFDLIEEEDDKIDFKIKAKHFVKLYAQLACMIPFENIEWEKLYWFIKFLIPKLKVRQAESDQLDKLLESIDLSSYGLERSHVSTSIPMEDEEKVFDPENANPRGVRGEPEMSDLDLIIAAFNDRYWSLWGDTPEEQRVNMLNFFDKFRNHEDFSTKVANITDKQNRDLAKKKILDELVNADRKNATERYKSYIEDSEYKQSLENFIDRMLERLDEFPAA